MKKLKQLWKWMDFINKEVQKCREHMMFGKF